MSHCVLKALILLLPAWLLVAGCSRERESSGKRAVGVTTSWLESAVRDVAGREFEIVRLLPPGQCPGHFDVSPGTVAKLSRCSLLFRFDFQEGLDARLSGLTSKGMRIISVATERGLCVPDTYARACRKIERALQEEFPDSGDERVGRLAAVENRLLEVSAKVREMVAERGVQGTKVICSEHQTSFCRWLGLDVAGEFSRAEDMTSAALEGIIDIGERSGARVVIANFQEGRRSADSIARRLGARVVVFSNFPSMKSDQERFDDLVVSNAESLVRMVGDDRSSN